MKKKVYYIRTNGYDMLVSVDEEKNCRYLTETDDFPKNDNDIGAFLESVEDDTSWNDDCRYDEIFIDSVEILAEIERYL